MKMQHYFSKNLFSIIVGIDLMSKKRSTKIVNVMTFGAGVIVPGLAILDM